MDVFVHTSIVYVLNAIYCTVYWRPKVQAWGA